MKTAIIHGTTIQVTENMTEVKDVCANPELFEKWQSKDQMFKDLLGTYLFNGELDESAVWGDYGTCLGSITVSDADCWSIEIYKVEDIEESVFKEEVLWSIRSFPSAFFMEDDEGIIYLICTNID